ncbi:MAG: hypothetical protein HY754_16165 [Nitrospirae bacterium]|nr:hypothetical protein [Nitrospirota bacterium]
MKKVFYIGLIIGGILGITIAAGMDVLLGESLGGGWREAMANDLNRLFNANLSQDHILVIAGVIFVVGIIGAFGALIGGISFVIIANFFKILTKEK